ncbi:MAG TPA: 2-hydroxyacid dehydrogenase [Bauldia sp.]|nr:2-hydroxyacid dehydrogenase [Bauldia sp.]
MSKVEVLVSGRLPAKAGEALADLFAVRGADGDLTAVRGFARAPGVRVDAAMLDRMPKLEILASFGVGYDGVDVAQAAARGIVVTNTPDVLTEEVADTTLGLLLMTVRELSAAERYLRAGKWASAPYPLTATLRDRTVGIVGLGRIGMAVARRLDAMQVPVVYHTRHARTDVAYRHYPDLAAMARDVDTLIVIVPGTPETTKLIDAHILRALGGNGVLINIGRGATVDEGALIAALKDGTIRAAGLDVFVNEPNVPHELVALPNAVLLPHVGSATVHTRDAMGQLVVDNLWNWFERKAPLTPVAETPWPPGRRT